MVFIKEFYDNGKEVIGFLIIVLVFSMTTDEKTTQYMILIVLLGMVLFNADTVVEFLKE